MTNPIRYPNEKNCEYDYYDASKKPKKHLTRAKTLPTDYLPMKSHRSFKA